MFPIHLLSGFGVFANTHFSKGEFLLEYIGEKISQAEAARRENKYSKVRTRKKNNPRCYMYFFEDNGKHLW